MFISVLSIIVPIAYYAALVWFEKKFYPEWSFDIGFYIFVFGLAAAAVVIPLLFKILRCPFTYWKLFLGISLSLAFGYLASFIVFHYMKLEDDPILMSEIIYALQVLVCTVFAVIGVNRNMWECLKNRGKKKEVVQTYRRYESAISSEPVDILTVFAISQSDYGFASDYMKKEGSAALLYEAAKQSYAGEKISEEEYNKLIRAAAAGGVGKAAKDCAKSYIRLEESDLMKLSIDEKPIAIGVLETLENEAKTDPEANLISKVLKARLQSSMVLYEANNEKYVEQLTENTALLKEVIESTRNEELINAAEKALELTEATIHVSLKNR